jgi:recombinational DNA repair protein RecR
VHLEPLPKGGECDTCGGTENLKEQGKCRVCFDGFEDQYKIIFTRRRKESKPSEDEI